MSLSSGPGCAGAIRVVPRVYKAPSLLDGAFLLSNFIPEKEVDVKLKGSEIICESLRREGVDVIFGHPGGAILPFYDALWGFPICAIS